eukprot:INCI696.2.p1 GENE.INCI696.2~~INCI696.2.p1  ORF type:complete len:393 (-),score=56.82 INCI696.2:487-1665(-)
MSKSCAGSGAPGPGGQGQGQASAHTAALDYLRSGGPVVDAHAHFVCADEVGGSYPLPVQTWFNSVGRKMGRDENHPAVGDFLEAEYEAAVAGLPPQGTSQSGVLVNVVSAVFVEVLPEGRSAVLEAAWALNSMVDSRHSRVEAVVVHAPVTAGRAAVQQFFRDVNGELAQRGNEWAIRFAAPSPTKGSPPERRTASILDDGDLPARTEEDPPMHPAIRGARQVFNGKGPAHDAAILDSHFLEGLDELGQLGLHFEFCVRAERIVLAAEVARRCPQTSFVLDHCGLNNTGQDFEGWKKSISELAALENVVGCKISAIEEWDPVDANPVPYIEHVLREFGPGRLMYGANWFVPLDQHQPPHPYSETAEMVASVLDGAHALKQGALLISAFARLC